MEERKKLIQWIKQHRKELVIVGLSIGALILIILGIKNRETIKSLWDSLMKAVKQTNVKTTETITSVTVEITPEPVKTGLTAVVSNSNSIPFEVSRHIRNLPDGWHASPEKIAEALKNNIILMDGQTWVDGYIKGGIAA